ncbi:hypothetical protein BS50DRAFT_640693 [Corynespora cassiicola Philippines]|uniref:Uncharacterized protein n=1 Tax=Corynespora cassiicola Philippines TaxID=1448308 RepID=A0A2T2N2T7_CORCC|nr:hypothetical protein BS50DRAFT_640693 [Corynespora cassiicola Philippines]
MKRERSASVDRNVDVSHERLRAAKRKQLDFHTRIGKYETKINQLQKKRAKLIRERDAFMSGPAEEAIVPYAQSATMQLVSQMRDMLPREIRDMVYHQLWNNPTYSFTSQFDGFINQLPCSERPCQCLRYIKGVPMLDPAYVGLEIAQEAAEALYKAHPAKFLTATRASKIKPVLTQDIFHIGFVPLTMAREMNIELQLDYSLRGYGDEKPYLTSCLKEDFDHLLKIPNKSGFKLRIHLTMRYIRLKVLDEMLSIITPIYIEFRRSNAIVDVDFAYEAAGRMHTCIHHNHSVQKNLNDYFISDPEEWRQEMIAYLTEREDDIIDHHRDYQFEDDEDYDPTAPEDYSSDGDEDIDDDFEEEDDFDFAFGHHPYFGSGGFGGYDSDFDLDNPEVEDFLYDMGLI